MDKSIMSDDILFSRFKLNNFTLKNRIGVAPMTRMSSPGDSIPRQDVLDFLVRRAQNGAAIVYTEAIVTDYESAQGYPRQARLTTQRQIEAWKPVVEAIRQKGAVSIMQMFHCGRMAWPEINPTNRVIAPSAISPQQKNPLTGEPAHAGDRLRFAPELRVRASGVFTHLTRPYRNDIAGSQPPRMAESVDIIGR